MSFDGVERREVGKNGELSENSDKEREKRHHHGKPDLGTQKGVKKEGARDQRTYRSVRAQKGRLRNSKKRGTMEAKEDRDRKCVIWLGFTRPKNEKKLKKKKNLFERQEKKGRAEDKVERTNRSPLEYERRQGQNTLWALKKASGGGRGRNGGGGAC